VKILHERHVMLASEYRRSTLRQAEPLGPVQHDARGDDVQDSLVVFLADLT
jgi:hypothetical protein